MDLNLDKEWLKRRVEQEGDHEVAAGQLALPPVKVRKGTSDLVRRTRRHDDPRRKNRAQQKRAWKRDMREDLS